jgi:DNA-binding NtrC family response regulator
LPVHLESLIANLEIAYMTACLDRSQGVKSEAAKLLGMNRTTMVEKLRRLKRLEVRQGASIDAMREYLKSLNGSALKPHEPSG